MLSPHVAWRLRSSTKPRAVRPLPPEISAMNRRFFISRQAAPAPAKSAPRQVRRRRPALEALECRALLSFLDSGQRISLNPEATDNTDSDNASSVGGTSVAVWVNEF